MKYFIKHLVIYKGNMFKKNIILAKNIKHKTLCLTSLKNVPLHLWWQIKANLNWGLFITRDQNNCLETIPKCRLWRRAKFFLWNTREHFKVVPNEQTRKWFTPQVCSAQSPSSRNEANCLWQLVWCQILPAMAGTITCPHLPTLFISNCNLERTLWRLGWEWSDCQLAQP